jgi:5-methylcytosine-specific restriction protein A
MAITTLKTRLSAASLGRVSVLATKAGTTPRERGRSWQRKRETVLLGADCMCVLCKVAAATEVDHVTPLEQGGSNSETNLQPLCHDCHAAKTKQEQRTRLGKM